MLGDGYRCGGSVGLLWLCGRHLRLLGLVLLGSDGLRSNNLQIERGHLIGDTRQPLLLHHIQHLEAGAEVWPFLGLVMPTFAYEFFKNKIRISTKIWNDRNYWEGGESDWDESGEGCMTYQRIQGIVRYRPLVYQVFLPSIQRLNNV